MTLDEAIKHLQEVIEQDDFSCAECKSEHEQLLEWLIELRERREVDE